MLLNRRKKKITKLRGSKTCGYGAKKKHRGAGHRGGKGRAGGLKHHWTYVVKYDPDRFGKYGFHNHNPAKKKHRVINLFEIETNIDKWVSEGKAEKKEDIYSVNLKTLGFNKVLATGKVTKKLYLQAEKFSEKAIEKIKAAGGKAEILSK